MIGISFQDGLRSQGESQIEGLYYSYDAGITLQFDSGAMLRFKVVGSLGIKGKRGVHTFARTIALNFQ